MKTLSITIDGKPYSVEAEGRNLLQVCLSLGFNLPYFCWHPALHSVGACRQCAVKLYKDASDTRGRIVMSCMTPVTEGMRVSVSDPEAKAFRGHVVEWLMVNHPHDCPICDEGGECHLQDMTVMSGHTYRRYRFTKRTHRNQDLGPFLNHEMNRCIQCYRCVRFYRDYAGGRDLEVQGWHDDVYFGRHTDGALENEFSGNLVEVCPTGVFTDKTLKEHYARKWDLQTAPSVCPHCSVGCNTIPVERWGELRRIRTRFNGEVNGYFLCDRGRYGYHFVNGPARIRQALVRKGAALAAVPAEEALREATAALGGGAVIGVGSARASLETNFALRDLVGPERFFIAEPDAGFHLQRLMARVLREGPAPAASIREAAVSDAVLLLGEDAWNTAPILGLALRQASINAPIARAMREKRINRWEDGALREAIRFQKGPLFISTVGETALDQTASTLHRGAPEDIARLGFAIAHELDSGAPAVSGLSDETQQLAARIARGLLVADHPLVVSGCSLGSAGIIEAASNVARALKTAGRDARISLVFPQANSLGAILLASGGIEAAARALAAAPGSTLVVAETDLSRSLDTRAFDAMLAGASRVIVIDHTETATTRAAAVVLPAATFAESSGTYVSSEGRAQRFFAVTPAKAPVQDSWRWLGELAKAKRPRGWQTLDAVIDAVAAELPELSGIQEAAPRADFRVVGQRIARKSHRESGRTAVTANIDLREPAPPQDRDSPLAWTMEGRQAQAPSELIPRFWSPGWNSDQSLNKFQIEVGGPLRGGDPGVRLIEASNTDGGRYFGEAPSAFTRRDGLLLVASHHVFGSEEMSMLSPGIAQRAPAPSLAMSEAEAGRRGLREGQRVRVTPEGGSAGSAMELTVVLRGLPDGVAAVPAGLPGVPPMRLPGFASVKGATG